MYNGAAAVGGTAGDGCTVAAVVGVVIAGVIAGATGTAGGDLRRRDVRFGSKAYICGATGHVRFTP